MSRVILPYLAADVSALARSLGGQLAECGHPPSHVELLNMLAKAQGCRNFQHFRAQAAARDRLDRVETPPEPVDDTRILRLMRFFDERGRLKQWPSKRGEQLTCLWALWTRLPAREALSEVQVNQRLKDAHLFGDHALLRRELIDEGLATRTPDGREYRRVEKRPPAEALALIRRLNDRTGRGA